jgi:hypothetical protein
MLRIGSVGGMALQGLYATAIHRVMALSIVVVKPELRCLMLEKFGTRKFG